MTAGKLSGLWLGLLLISVLANGVMGGVLIQRAAAPEADDVLRPGVELNVRQNFNPRAFMAALPETHRSDARAVLREGLREARPLFRDAVQARIDAQEALIVEPFDPEAIAEALVAARAAQSALEAHAERVLLSIAADLPADVRIEAINAAYGGRAPFGRLGPEFNGPT